MKKRLKFGSASLPILAAFCRATRTSHNTDFPSHSKQSCYYVGVGIGTFGAANKFKANEDNYLVAAKPKPHPAVMPTVTIGYQFNKNFRIDLNGQYRRFKYAGSAQSASTLLTTYLNQNNIKNHSVFLNGYAQMAATQAITPYLTAGVGYSHFNPGALTSKAPPLTISNTTHTGRHTTKLAWNVGAGAHVGFARNLGLDISYRYVYLNKFKMNAAQDSDGDTFNGSSQHIRTHEGMIALVYKFQ